MNPSILIAATLGATAASDLPPPPANPPITLVTETSDTGVTVRVVGHADTAVTARYSLEVTSGGNHTVQSGAVRLRPGDITTLLTSRMGSDRQRPWTATLRVEPEGQMAYQVDRGS